MQLMLGIVICFGFILFSFSIWFLHFLLTKVVFGLGSRTALLDDVDHCGIVGFSFVRV
jgi:hypothetical protein